MDYDIKLPKQKVGRKTVQQKIIYDSELRTFSNKLQEIQFDICGTMRPKETDKVSARGWCYLLEGFGTISKDQFDKCFKVINLCRKEGYLPIDFVALDESRGFFNVEGLTENYETPYKYLKDWLEYVKNIDEKKTDVAFWESQKYYLQMVVEKIDVRNLFHDVCEKYHIPISNAKGWSDMLSRNDLVQRFKEAQEIGLIPILLYYGDFDPAGIKIADTFKKNLMDLMKATGYNPDKLEIDHFGLTIDFINDNGLLWINNLITGGKRDLGKLYDQYLREGKERVKIFDYEIEYIRKYGVRKCEANAILPKRDIAINDCEKTIQKYLGENPFETYDEKIKEVQKETNDLMEKIDFKIIFQNLLDELEKNK